MQLFHFITTGGLAVFCISACSYNSYRIAGSIREHKKICTDLEPHLYKRAFFNTSQNHYIPIPFTWILAYKSGVATKRSNKTNKVLPRENKSKPVVPRKVPQPKTRAAASQKDTREVSFLHLLCPSSCPSVLKGTFLVTQRGTKQQVSKVEAYLAPEGASQRGASDNGERGGCRELQ